jgi:hypothetical protein
MMLYSNCTLMQYAHADHTPHIEASTLVISLHNGIILAFQASLQGAPVSTVNAAAESFLNICMYVCMYVFMRVCMHV